MIVVVARGTKPEQTAEILAEIERLGLGARVLRCGDRSLIHIHSGPTRLARRLVRMERVVGLAPTSGPRVRRQGRRFFPYHMLSWSALTLLLMGVLVALAGFFPPGLGQRIDLAGGATAVQPGYLFVLDRAASRLPGGAWVAWLTCLAFLGALFVLPYLDGDEDAGPGRRVPALGLAAVLLLAAVFLLV